MQVCTSLQTDNHANTPPLVFYRPDALLAAQQRQSTEGTSVKALKAQMTVYKILQLNALHNCHQHL